MKIRYEDAKLERLANDPTFSNGLSDALVKAYRKRIQQILDAANEQDLRGNKAAHYEKLIGNRQGQYSMRLNKQWRLILRIEQDNDGKRVVIVSIVDYH